MARFNFLGFLAGQLLTRLPLVKADLKGKTVIVTGSNVGLGKETARYLAAMNPARIIIACRDTTKGQAAADDISRTTGCETVEVWQLDLSSFASVKAFAARVDKDLSRLDILVENAGIATDKWKETADGYESTLQVNVISTGMLALLCLPKMRETVRTFKTEPRIVVVGSEVHFWSPFVENKTDAPLRELNTRSSFVPGDRYNVSKLLDLLFVREFAQKLETSSHPEDKSIKVNCPNPGLCHSELGRDAGWGLYLLKLGFARTTEYGARVFVWSAIADEAQNGAFISDCDNREPSDLTISEAGAQGQKKIWAELMDIYAKQAPAAAKAF